VSVEVTVIHPEKARLARFQADALTSSNAFVVRRAQSECYQRRPTDLGQLFALAFEVLDKMSAIDCKKGPHIEWHA
jgi:hypothetical protein